MPIPAGVARCSLVGHAASAEIFDTSFWITTDALNGLDDAYDVAASVASAFETDALTHLCGRLPTTAGYDTVKVYAYPTGGPKATFVGESPITGGTGASGNGNLPATTCVVASLRTGLSGRSRRGRMYIPNTNATLVGHLFQDGQGQEIADALAQMFSTINQADFVGDVSVVSQFLGLATKVTQVICDSKPDVQRSRAEGLTSLPIANAGVI